MRTSLLTIAMPIALAFSTATQADWALQQPSSVHFLTSKNIHNTEVHQFKTFDAEIKDTGYAKFTIDLTSVDTRISIRDSRMIEHLFEVSKFGNASFEADIDQDVLQQVNEGKSLRYKLEGKLSLHGEKANASCEVLVTKNADQTISVNSITPMLIDAEDFDLIAGINKLREMAKLKSITHTVPVTFNLTFKAN